MSRNVDIEQLKKYQEAIEELSEGELYDLNVSITKDLANRVVRRTKKNTPVVTGELRRHFKAEKLKKTGDVYAIDVVNPINYASYVEFGHRYKNDSHEPYQGRHMLQNAINSVDAQAPRIAKKKVEDYIKRKLNG